MSPGDHKGATVDVPGDGRLDGWHTTSLDPVKQTSPSPSCTQRAEGRLAEPRKEAVMIGTPPAERKVLGTTPRRHREILGYSVKEAAGILECDRSKISRIKTGLRGIRSSGLWALLQEYGVAEDVRRALAAIADPRCTPGWWRQYTDVLPEAYRDYLILEAVASKVMVYESRRVPELLQTAQYASAVAAASTIMPAAVRDRSAQAMLARRRAVLAGDLPELAVVTGEAWRPNVGGDGGIRAPLGRIATIGAGIPEVSYLSPQGF
jgi:Domain of unknown function (DUF5753)/Helix-turn-helix domain